MQSTTKPGVLAPGVCLLSRGAVPRGTGAAARSVDRLQIRVSSVVVGVAGAGTWGQVSIGTFRWVRGTSGGAMDGDLATRQERQKSVESVGAGAGSSAHSWLLLRGGVFHRWSLRIPLQPEWIRRLETARAAAGSTSLVTSGNASSCGASRRRCMSRTGLIQPLPHRRSMDRLRAALLMLRAASRADASQPTCSMAALRSASQRGLPLDPARPASGSPLRLPWLPHPASAPSSSSAPAPWSCSAGVFLRLDQGQAQGHAPGAWPQ